MKQANDQVFSAGTQPTEVRKEAIRVMRELECLGSSLEAAERLHRPRLDFAITVCDKAREECPIFSGAPERLHWPFEGPPAFTETGQGSPKLAPAPLFFLYTRYPPLAAVPRAARRSTGPATALCSSGLSHPVIAGSLPSN